MTLIEHKLSEEDTLTLFLEPVHFPDASTNEVGDLQDYIYWILLAKKHVFETNLDNGQDFLHLSPSQAAALSKKLTSTWHHSISPLVTSQSDSAASALRICAAVPDIQPWTPSARVTLLGDAAHPMTPTAGFGAVTALRDVRGLLKAILSGISEESIGEYEETMRGYANDAIKGGKSAAEKFIGKFDWAGLEEV